MLGASSHGDPVRLVVVGGGMTAHRVVERLVAARLAPGMEITLLSEEEHAPYDRIHLGSIVAGSAGHELALRDESWYADHGIRLTLKQRVVSIDREARRVCTATGESVEYDRLVLATGGAPVRPKIPGLELPGVATYRTREDAEAIARRAVPGARVVVAGGGLLGLELARGLVGRGCRVDVIEMAPRLLPRQLDADGAAVLEREIGALGIGLRLLSRVAEIAPVDDALRVTLSDGDRFAADLVVVAAGIRPRDDLARASGIACHDRGGVLVDDRLATSDPHVDALGECVRHRGETYGFVAPCYEMVEVWLARMLGERRAFTGAVPAARLKIDEIDVAAVGESLAEGVGVSALSWVQDDEYRRIVLRDGRIVGAIAVGAGSEFPRLQEAVAHGARVRAWQLRRFDRFGRLWPEGSEKPIEMWPDAAVVCTCTGVTCGSLRAARAAGARTCAALGEQTDAGSVCGSCEPLLRALTGEQTGARRKGAGPGLGLAAIAGLAGVVAFALAPPIPMSTSFETGPGIDWIWRDGLAKQISGFALLALVLASLVFSLRKRIARFRVGSVAGWRVAHAALGAATVGGLVAHTGFRLGANLNRALMLCFLAAALVGALAGLVTWLERRLPPAWAGALQRGWSAAHVFVVWPLPVLTAAHVLAVYFY